MHLPPASDVRRPGQHDWRCVQVLDQARRLVSGNPLDLATAIGRGADLRVYTEFRHCEHIDTTSKDSQLIQEAADFRVTYLMERRFASGIINLRQPVELPVGFGARPSMSFFLYNQDGTQAIARPYLDGRPATAAPGPSPVDDHSQMPKYHQFDGWDAGTNAPSSNFAYAFETMKFWVCDNWEEVLCHAADGEVQSGSLEQLRSAFAQGREVKVGIRGLCADIPGATDLEHEVFVQCGSCYYYTESRFFIAAAHPLVRVRPAVPLRYSSKGWDFGWLMPRSDGHVARWLLDPYTLKFHRSQRRHAIRWFVR
jgi:hypothetical protein